MISNFFGKRKYKYTLTVCCIVKDENPYLEEWIDYHFKVGVRHFFIYDHESKIPVADTIRKFIESGIATVTNIKGKAVQTTAYRQCLKKYGRYCQWIAFIDADEFLVPKNPSCNLPELLSRYSSFGGLGINWYVFGSNGHTKRQKSQIQSYTRRSLKTQMQNRNYKSIVQPRYVKHPINPHWFRYKAGRYCVTENFDKLKTAITDTHSSNSIQLNHYNLRSLEEFEEKMLRGRADTADPTQLRTIDFFWEVDGKSNVITDETILEVQMILDSAQ